MLSKAQLAGTQSPDPHVQTGLRIIIKIIILIIIIMLDSLAAKRVVSDLDVHTI